MEEKEKILNIIEEKIFKEGFYKTTMDELASDLQMSKKTIYKIFPSKNDLVKEIIGRFTKRTEKTILEILHSDQNAVQKITRWLSILSKITTKISDKTLNDLRIHFPHLWDEVDKFRTEMMTNNISKLIEQGKREGLVKELPTPIIMTVIISAIRSTVNPQFIIHNNFSLMNAAQVTFQILMYGILTEKGTKIFKKSISGIIK